MGDKIIMSEKELNRLDTIHQALSGQISRVTASNMLGLSYRQTKRIVKRIKQYGGKGIIHRNRGKPSLRKIPKSLENKITSIYAEKYPDFGPTLANEKLNEIHGIKISTEKLRQLLIKKPYRNLNRENVILRKTLDDDIRIISKRCTLSFKEIAAGNIKAAI